MSPIKGRDTVSAMTQAFQECERESIRFQSQRFNDSSSSSSSSTLSGIVLIPNFVAACGSTISLYAHVFGEGSFIARILGRTTTRHMNCITNVQKLYEEQNQNHQQQQQYYNENASSNNYKPTHSLRRLLVWERDTRGKDAVRFDRASAGHTAMWLSRGLLFCETFMHLLADGSEKDAEEAGVVLSSMQRTKSNDARDNNQKLLTASSSSLGPRVCAAAAYNKTLRPYHGFLLSTVFMAALGYAPEERKALFDVFGYDDMREGEQRVRECVAAMRPVTRRVSAIILEEGLEFKDKATPMQGALS
jgi:hypothetical protein